MKKKLLVYSHDTYGLGNLRRMTALCQHLTEHDESLAILLVSGSPMAHAFRLGAGVDYLKLPCLTRTANEDYAAKFLPLTTHQLIKLRADVLLATLANYQPDLLLVDKKPFGVKNELAPALQYAQEHLPALRKALILRDILDAPAVTTAIWQQHEYYAALESFYDQVLVLGVPEIFDVRTEYQFPAAVADKVRFCGYIRRPLGAQNASEIRQSLKLRADEKLVLITPGGGEDGFALIQQTLAALRGEVTPNIFPLVITGSEMEAAQRAQVAADVASLPRGAMIEFTDDLMSYLAAADLVVAMAGYNTVSELLTLGSRALLVPRHHPVSEQLIRAERLAARGQVRWLHPATLTPNTLRAAMLEQLAAPAPAQGAINLDALPNVTRAIQQMLKGDAA